jgi:CheY-like chemotaxis protein
MAMPRARVLLVDDDPRIRRTLARALGDRYDVVAATGGQAALTALAGDARFDLILCDAGMAGTSGLDVYRALCDRAPALARRFVLISAALRGSELDDVERLRIPFLPTPIEPAALCAAVSGAIERANNAR